MGQFVILKENVLIRPTTKKEKGKLSYQQMDIGNNVYIDRGSVICALSIGSNVHIGKNCIIGHRTKIHDNCKILDGSILPPDTVVSPLSVFGGQPAVYLGELAESMQIVNQNLAQSYYNNFIGVNAPAEAPK